VENGTLAPAPRTLRAGAVGLWGDVVASITCVAPSASVALTLGPMIAVARLAGPSVMLVVGFTMLCIAIAFNRLSYWQPSAAAGAMWVARSVRPIIGLALGFMILILALVANVGNSTLFGPYLLGIVAPSQASNTALEFLTSALAIVVVAAIAIIGIRAAIRFQAYVVWAEYAIMLVFIIALFVAEFSGKPGTVVPNLAWLLPTQAPSLTGWMLGILFGVFMAGGWEASVYLAEEQHDANRHPGRAGILGVLFTTFWYVVLIMAIQGIASPEVLVKNSANLVSYAADQVFTPPFNILVSLAVLSSVVAVVQSQLQNFSRMGFGLSRDGLLPSFLARLTRRHTPAIGLSIAAAVPIVLLGIYLANTNAATVLSLISGTGGILNTTLYVVAALACVWYYRKTLAHSTRQLFYAGILPILGSIILLVTIGVAIPNTPLGTVIPAAVFVFAGIPLAWFVKRRTRAPFFDRPVLVADPTEVEPKELEVVAAP
jgi:amino acid transporter